MKEHIARAVRRLVPEIFGPVGSISNFGIGPSTDFTSSASATKRRDEWIARRAVAALRQPAQLEPMTNAGDAARRLGEKRMMRHHAP